MGKLLSWIAMGFALYVAYKVVLALQRKSQLRGERSKKAANEPAQSASEGKPQPGQTGHELISLVSCAHCGLQLPKHEALTDAKHTYCSKEHLRLGVTPKDAD